MCRCEGWRSDCGGPGGPVRGRLCVEIARILTHHIVLYENLLLKTKRVCIEIYENIFRNQRISVSGIVLHKLFHNENMCKLKYNVHVT